MKGFINWLRRKTAQQSITSEADQRDVGVKVRPNQKKDDEYSDVSSYNWEATDRVESSGSRPDMPKPNQCDHENTVPQTTLNLEDGPSYGTEEDVGVDPYNTGRYDTEIR